jgi:hypothetical protein
MPALDPGPHAITTHRNRRQRTAKQRYVMSTIPDDPNTLLSRGQTAKAPTDTEFKTESTMFATKATQGEGDLIDYWAPGHRAVGAQPAAGCRSENANRNYSMTTAFSDFCSEINFLPGEDPQDYAKLKAGLFAEHEPCGRSQEKLMESVTKALWKLRRAQRLGLHRELASDTRE